MQGNHIASENSDHNIYPWPDPWQKQQWQYLISRINTNTMPHALLLKGAEGLGKSTFALNLAALLFSGNAPQFNAA